jgi:enolase
VDQSAITSIWAWEILDSRGNPTVEVEVTVGSDERFIASCPSGTSTGKHEAYELRDNDKTRFSGKGVLKAVANVNEKISRLLAGRKCTDQGEIDRLMIEADGSENMRMLGANATTAVSLACAKAAAGRKGVSLHQHISDLFGSSPKDPRLPVPAMNVINGGKHAGSGLAIQEFLIFPIGSRSNSNTISAADSIRKGSEIYHNLANILASRLGRSAINVGDEGGFAPSLEHDELALSYICEAISQSGYEVEKDVLLGIDAAASNFWNDSKQKYVMGNDISMGPEDLLTFYSEMADKYHLSYIEDPFMEEDFDSFARVTQELGSKVTITGDDIFVTDKVLMNKGIEAHAANGIIIKVNQVGTLTEALEAASKASIAASWKVIASHRSGETNDYWLADLAVGIGANAIKAGAPARGERIAKYHRLMRIEQGEKEFR